SSSGAFFVSDDASNEENTGFRHNRSDRDKERPMVDQKLISDWNRNQGAYEQARYFTPGKHENEVRTTHQGEPRTLDLLVVVHNDVEPAGPGQSRVDLIV